MITFMMIEHQTWFGYNVFAPVLHVFVNNNETDMT